MDIGREGVCLYTCTCTHPALEYVCLYMCACRQSETVPDTLLCMFVSLTNNNVSKSVERFPVRVRGIASAVALFTSVKGLQEDEREKEREREREREHET